MKCSKNLASDSTAATVVETGEQGHRRLESPVEAARLRVPVRTSWQTCAEGPPEDEHRCLFRSIAEFTYDWEDWISPEGKLWWVNSAVERLTGYSVADCLAMPDYPLPMIHEDDRQYMAKHFREARAGSIGFDLEFRIRRKDGSEAWMAAAWQPICIEGLDSPNGYRTSIREISDRKVVELALRDAWANLEERVQERTEELARANEALRAEIKCREQVEQQLRDSQQRHALALQGTSDGLWDWDLLTGKVYYAPRFKELLGYENHDQEFGDDFEAFGSRLHPEDYPRVQDALDNHFDHRFPLDIEYRLRNKVGEYHWFRARGQAVWNVSGQAVRMAGSIMDIHSRKQAEEERDRFFSMSLDLLCVGKFDGFLKRVNPSFERTLGYTTEELLQRPYMEFIHPDDHETTIAELKRLAQGEPVLSFEHRLLSKEGAVHWFTWTAAPIAEEGVFYGVAHDTTHRRQYEDQIQNLNATLKRQLGRIAALHRIDRAITSGYDLRLTLTLVLEQVIEQLGVDGADLLLIDPETGDLAHFVSQGLRSEGMKRFTAHPGDGVCGQVLQQRRSLHIPDLQQSDLVFLRADAMAEEGCRAYSAVPLLAKGQIKGVLEVFHRAPLNVDAEWLDFLEALAGQAAIGLDNITMFEGLQRSNHELTVAYDATIEGWSRVLEYRDRETQGHSQRVTEMTVKLAQALGIEGEELVQMRRGALLHDIGKLSIPDSILLKNGPLSEDEWTIMRRHPQIAFDLLGAIPFLQPALDIPYCHHERWDGQGYPRQLQGEQIPLSARIFAAVDIWDALSHDRPYRQAWPPDKVREHLASLAGNQLDPQIVPVFLDLLAREATRSADDRNSTAKQQVFTRINSARLQAVPSRAAAASVRAEAATVCSERKTSRNPSGSYYPLIAALTAPLREQPQGVQE